MTRRKSVRCAYPKRRKRSPCPSLPRWSPPRFGPPRRVSSISTPSPAPRSLRPRPVAADSGDPASVRGALAWFWNSNPDWADEQVVVADRYSELVAVLLRGLGVGTGDRIVLSASEPEHRRKAWTDALPAGASVTDWRPRRSGRLSLDDLEGLLDPRPRLVLLTKACPITGALNEVVPFAQRLEGSGVALVAEVSHFAAHGPLDLRNLRCDAAIAASSELFGARGAALWARRLDGVGPARDGLASPETLASLSRVLGYAARLGEAPGAPQAPPSERFRGRESMRKGMQSIRHEERTLSRRVLAGLSRIPGISVFGETGSGAGRVPDPGVHLHDGRKRGGSRGGASRGGGCGLPPAISDRGPRWKHSASTRLRARCGPRSRTTTAPKTSSVSSRPCRPSSDGRRRGTARSAPGRASGSCPRTRATGPGPGPSGAVPRLRRQGRTIGGGGRTP